MASPDDLEKQRKWQEDLRRQTRTFTTSPNLSAAPNSLNQETLDSEEQAEAEQSLRQERETDIDQGQSDLRAQAQEEAMIRKKQEEEEEKKDKIETAEDAKGVERVIRQQAAEKARQAAAKAKQAVAQAVEKRAKQFVLRAVIGFIGANIGWILLAALIIFVLVGIISIIYWCKEDPVGCGAALPGFLTAIVQQIL